MSGTEKTIRKIVNGTMKKRIWLTPEARPRTKDSRSSLAQLSESSVNMAVVMGTVRMA